VTWLAERRDGTGRPGLCILPEENRGARWGACGPCLLRSRHERTTTLQPEFASAKPHLLLYAGVIMWRHVHLSACASCSSERSCSASWHRYSHGAELQSSRCVTVAVRRLTVHTVVSLQGTTAPSCPSRPGFALARQAAAGQCAAMIWLVATVAFVCSVRVSADLRYSAERHAHRQRSITTRHRDLVKI
jgi:hypothetical protein